MYKRQVKQQLYTNNTYKAEHQSAIASFLPSISTQVDAQYRFGRSVDPETNAFHLKGVFFDFGLFLFVKYQGVSQQSPVSRIYAYGFAFAGDYQRFQHLHLYLIHI